MIRFSFGLILWDYHTSLPLCVSFFILSGKLRAGKFERNYEKTISAHPNGGCMRACVPHQVQ